jgi:GNAT superfamily N-acetyltransferase
MFTLRDAVISDCPDIARLVRALAEYEKLADEARATAQDFQTQLFGPTPVAYAMVAEVGGHIAGLALWFYNFSTFVCRPGLYVEDVFVEPEHRGLGIGRAFFRAMAQRALEKGCGRMEWSVLDWNEPAIAFYRGLGAVGMQDWTIQRLTAEKIARLAHGE